MSVQNESVRQVSHAQREPSFSLAGKSPEAKIVPGFSNPFKSEDFLIYVFRDWTNYAEYLMLLTSLDRSGNSDGGEGIECDEREWMR